MDSDLVMSVEVNEYLIECDVFLFNVMYILRRVEDSIADSDDFRCFLIFIVCDMVLYYYNVSILFVVYFVKVL